VTSETDEVRERKWETNDGWHTNANRRKSRTPPLRQTMTGEKFIARLRETGKFGDTWRKTHDERQVKARKRHPESQTPLDSVGNKWRETKEEIHPKSRIPPARKGAKWRETSKEMHLKSRTPPARVGDKWREANETNNWRARHHKHTGKTLCEQEYDFVTNAFTLTYKMAVHLGNP